MWKASVEGEIERLARLRAKRRVHTWKSPWFWVSFSSVLFLATFGFIFLIDAWHLRLNVFIPAMIGLGCFFWWLDRSHKKWERQQYKSFYEEELLELKVKKESQREAKPLLYNQFPLSFEGEGD